MSTLAILGLLFLLNLLLTAVMIRLSSALLGARRSGFGWSLLASLLLATIALGQLAVLYFIPTPMGILLVEILTAVLAFLCVWCCVGATLARTLFILLAAMAPAGLGIVLVVFLIRPFVLEAFVVPSNNMAPAVRGWHREETCPKCGGRLLLPLAEPGDPRERLPDFHRVAICADCLREIEYDPNEFLPPADLESVRKTPDRILVNKLLSPRRWDVIEFRYPPKTEIKYIMRLVALPGEKVFLKDGAVWVNGVKLDMPMELQGLRYGEDPGGIPTRLGAEDAPLTLGPNDCAVLGDYSSHSNDSRIFGVVPTANIEGVATLIYWPRERWQILR